MPSDEVVKRAEYKARQKQCDERSEQSKDRMNEIMEAVSQLTQNVSKLSETTAVIVKSQERAVSDIEDHETRLREQECKDGKRALSMRDAIQIGIILAILGLVLDKFF